MLSDKDLHDVYDAGAQTTHMTGLKAVWAKAVAWEKDRAAGESKPKMTPLPTIDPSGIPSTPRKMV